MPTKVFTTLGGLCPFGRGIEIDSLQCRRCPYYYRTGTAMFFWCNATPAEPVPNPVREILHPKPKRGRPRKTDTPVKAQKKPVKTRKKKNG